MHARAEAKKAERAAATKPKPARARKPRTPKAEGTTTPVSGGGAFTHLSDDPQFYGSRAVETITARVDEQVRLHEAGEDIGGPVESVLWRRKRGMKVQKWDEHVAGLIDKDPKVLRKIHKNQVAEARQLLADQAEDDRKAEHAATIGEAAEALASNPAMRKAAEKYGQAPIFLAGWSPGLQSSAQYHQGPGVIVTFVNMTGQQTSPLQVVHGSATGINVDPSIQGTLRHEFGHHVSHRLSNGNTEQQAIRDEFTAKWREWVDSEGGSYGGRDEQRMVADMSEGKAMIYARSLAEEGFAETFSAVTHPDWANAKKKTSPQFRAMAEVMERILQ